VNLFFSRGQKVPKSIVESLRDLPYGDIILHTFIGERLKAETVKDRENNTSLDNVKERSRRLLLAGADRCW
jgi:hypothetical protein